MLKLIPFFFATMLPQNVFCDEGLGPHGGKVVQDNSNRFEVKIDQDAKNIEIYTLNAKRNSVPKKMEVTLFKDSGTGQTIDLKAVDARDPLPKFQGEISPSAGSFIGAELRFGVSLKSLHVLKFIPYIPGRTERF